MKEKIELLQKLLMTCELLAAFAGLVYWRRISDFRVKAFILYLSFIAAAEQTGWYMKHHHMKNQTSALFTYLVIPVEFLFIYWFIYQFSPSALLKKMCIYFAISGLLINVVEIFFFGKEKYFFSSLSYLVYALFLLILVLAYLLNFTKSDKIITYWKDFSFWVSSACLIYYLSTFPLYAFYNYLWGINKALFYIYWELQMYLNMLMYILFTTGLLWTNRKYRQSFS